MILKNLSIINYRNLQDVQLELSQNVNCFVGDNGQGKTNVLDAIYYLSFCKSSVCSQDALNIFHDAPFFMLQGNYENENGVSASVNCSLQRGARKRIKRDDKEYKRLAEHIGTIPLVMISPMDSLLVTGGSEERRAFMDIVISQYDAKYLELLMKYNKALQQRNQLLKQEQKPDWTYVDVLECIMDEASQYIYSARKKFIEGFLPIFRQMYARLGNLSQEQVDIVYESHGERGSLKEILTGWRDKERIVGYTLHGIHKDNLLFRINGFELKREGSQGQTKTFFISLKLAQYIYLKQLGSCETPLLLLDDIFDKLDAGRVANIIKYVSGSDFGQIFITDTNREHLDQILAVSTRDYRLFFVENGVVK